MKKTNIKKLLISLAIPLLSGALVGVATKESVGIYKTLNKPAFAPPSAVFPVVWSVLYFLMGISLYLVAKTPGDKQKAYYAFAVQLAANISWSFFFFEFNFYLTAFIVTLVMIIAIINMIKEFSRLNKTGAYLQIPYLLWVIFASLLNFFIYIMN